MNRNVLTPMIAMLGAGAMLASSVAEAQWVMVARRAVGRVEQMSHGEQIAGIKVSPLGDNLTHMMISSAHTGSQPDASALVLNAVLRVCKDMSVECDSGQTPGRPVAPR
jgi:hypothetical protein